LWRLIREGFEQRISGEKLAEAAGLSVPRVYQIRDGRRRRQIDGTQWAQEDRRSFAVRR
jgi:hypothetical protein